MKTLRIDPNEIQMCLSSSVAVMPRAYLEYIRYLKQLAKRRKICLMPIVILEEYDIHITQKLKQYIEYFPTYAQRRIAKRRAF